MIVALFEHSPIFHSFKPDVVQSLLDRHVEISKQVTVQDWVSVRFEAHPQLKTFKYHKAGE